MNLRGLATDIASNSTVLDASDGEMSGNIIVILFILIAVICIINSANNGGCDSSDTDGNRVHRANLRRGARGQGPYA